MPEVLPTTQKLSYAENIYIPVLQFMKTEAQTCTRSWLGTWVPFYFSLKPSIFSGWVSSPTLLLPFTTLEHIVPQEFMQERTQRVEDRGRSILVALPFEEMVRANIKHLAYSRGSVSIYWMCGWIPPQTERGSEGQCSEGLVPVLGPKENVRGSMKNLSIWVFVMISLSM